MLQRPQKSLQAPRTGGLQSPKQRSGTVTYKRTNTKSVWQPEPHGLAATNTLGRPNPHTVEFSKAEDENGGSPMALESPHSEEVDKVKAPKYKSSFAHRTANKERRMAAEASDGRKRREHRKSRQEDDGFET